MAKSKKSKILATALCTAVMAGIYAGPVMAADTGLTVDGNKVVAEDVVTINGVKFVPNASYADQGITADYRGHISINGLTISNAGAIDMKGESINNVGTFTSGNGGNNFQLTSQGVQILVGQQDVNDKFIVKSYADGNTSGGSAYIKTQNGEVVLAQSDDNKTVNNKLVVGKDGITVDGKFTVNGVEFADNTPGEVPDQGIGVDKEGNTAVNGVVIKTVDKNSLSRANNKDIVIGAEGADDVNISAIDRNVAGISRSGTTTMVNGNIRATANIIANQRIGVVNGSQYGLIAEKNTIALGQFKINDSAETIKENAKFYVDGSTGNVITKGDVTTEAGYSLNSVGANTAGIKRANGVTDIEGVAQFGKGYMQVGYTILAKDGSIGAANGKFTVTPDGEVIVSGENGSTNINGNGITVGDTAITNGVITTHKADIGGVEIANGRVDGVDVSELSGSVFDNSKDITELERKTTGIDYANGTTTVGGVEFKDGAITAADGKFTVDQYGIASANVLKAHSVLFDGGSISATGISAVNGKFVVHEDGSVKSFGDVESENYSLEEIGKNLGDLETGVSADLSDLKQKTSTLTVIEGTPEGNITNISSHLNVQGDISANGDVTTKAGASLNGLNEQVKEDALKIHNLQVNTAGITRDGAVTTIEGATSFDADGMKMVGDNVTEFVNINKDGSMAVSNGDASFYFNKNDIALNNGNNSIMVGNESITLSTTGAALTMSKDGLDYADGAFKVAADGSLRIASGTENSITLDAKTGVIYANDFSTGEYSLNAIGDQLNELETGVGEDITDLKRKTTDIEYADGATTIAGATKFTENGMQVGTTVINKDGSIGAADGNFTVTADGEVIVRGENGATSITGDAITIGDTVIKDGIITTHKAEIGGVEIANGRVDGVDVSELAGSVFDGSKDIAELQRITTGMDYQNGVTSFSGDITFKHNGDTVSLGGLVDKVNDIYDRTSGISKDENGNTVIDGGLVVDGDTTGTGGSITGNGDMNISGDGQIGGDLDVAGSVNTDNVNTGNINAGKGTIGGVHMENGEITTGDTTINGDGITVGGEDGKVVIDDSDVSVIDKDGNEVGSIMGNAQDIDRLEEGMASMSNRISKVEDRIDKVGAMSAAIANLRTMGYDPTAPTEIAVGVGQYRSETGVALGMFHYPNKDFMLSLSVSTSGDEVMGGIGATWKFGRKTPEQMLQAEQEKAAKAKVEKALAMKKAAEEAKVAAQQAKHAKMAAEKAAK